MPEGTNEQHPIIQEGEDEVNKGRVRDRDLAHELADLEENQGRAAAREKLEKKVDAFEKRQATKEGLNEQAKLLIEEIEEVPDLSEQLTSLIKKAEMVLSEDENIVRVTEVKFPFPLGEKDPELFPASDIVKMMKYFGDELEVKPHRLVNNSGRESDQPVWDEAKDGLVIRFSPKEEGDYKQGLKIRLSVVNKSQKRTPSKGRDLETVNNILGSQGAMVNQMDIIKVTE